MPLSVKLDTQRSSAVHVATKLLSSSLRFGSLGELDDTFSSGSITVKEDFGRNDRSDSLEQFDQVLIRGRPWELEDQSMGGGL